MISSVFFLWLDMKYLVSQKFFQNDFKQIWKNITTCWESGNPFKALVPDVHRTGFWGTPKNSQLFSPFFFDRAKKHFLKRLKKNPDIKKIVLQKSQNFIERPFRNTQQRLLTPPERGERAISTWSSKWFLRNVGFWLNFCLIFGDPPSLFQQFFKFSRPIFFFPVGWILVNHMKSNPSIF